MTEPCVLTKLENHVATIALNRVDRRNAIDWATLDAIEEHAIAFGKDPEAKVIVLRGNGKAFSAGIDLNALASFAQPDARPGGAALRETIARIQGVNNRVALLEKPVIAALHGVCLGLGLELVLAADIRIAEEGTEFGLPEMVMGLIPDCGGTTRLSRCVGRSAAKRMILTGDRISAEEALRIGLVDELTAPGELDTAVNALCERLVRRSPLALGLAKRTIDACQDMSPTSQFELEGYTQSLIMGAPEFMENLQMGMMEIMSHKTKKS